MVVLFPIRYPQTSQQRTLFLTSEALQCKGVREKLTFSAKTESPDNWVKCMNSRCRVPNSARMLLPPEAQGQFLPIPLKRRTDRRGMGQTISIFSTGSIQKGRLLNDGSWAHSPLWICENTVAFDWAPVSGSHFYFQIESRCWLKSQRSCYALAGGDEQIDILEGTCVTERCIPTASRILNKIIPKHPHRVPEPTLSASTF